MNLMYSSTRNKNKKATASEAILKGLEAEQKGEYYHPAVNKEIDRLTDGYSTKIQLESLVENVRLAHALTDK